MFVRILKERREHHKRQSPALSAGKARGYGDTEAWASATIAQSSMSAPPIAAARTSMNLLYLGTSRLHRRRANLIQTLHTGAAMRDLGMQPRFYFPPFSRADLAARLEEFGIDPPLDASPSTLLHSRWRRWRYAPFVRVHKAELQRADVVYTRSLEISLSLARAQLPHVFEVHDTSDIEAKGAMTTLIENHRAGSLAWLVPISHAAAARLANAGADPRRIHVSPSGVDVAAFGRVPDFDPDRLDRPRVLYLGRLSRSRGLVVLGAVAERGIAEVTLVGEQEDQVAEAPGISVVPSVPHRDIPLWYARSDLVLLPYQPSLGHADSISPLKLFEAFAAGRPVIASDIAPIRELIEDGRNGLLVPPDDIAAWFDAVERLRGDKHLAAALARAGRETAARYSWSRRVENLARALGWPVPSTARAGRRAAGP